jgi:hypothetical protein
MRGSVRRAPWCEDGFGALEKSLVEEKLRRDSMIPRKRADPTALVGRICPDISHSWDRYAYGVGAVTAKLPRKYISGCPLTGISPSSRIAPLTEAPPPAPARSRTLPSSPTDEYTHRFPAVAVGFAADPGHAEVAGRTVETK